MSPSAATIANTVTVAGPAPLPRRRAAPPVRGQALEQLRRFRRRGMRLIQDHDIEAAEFDLMPSKGLANDTLDPVSAAGLTAVFSRDGEAEPGEIGFIVPAQYRETFVATSKSLLEDTAESRRRQQPMLSRKPIRVSAIQALELYPADVRMAMIRESGRQACPAFGTATLEHEPAGLGRHPGAEAVGTGALQFAGLIGAFHLPDT